MTTATINGKQMKRLQTLWGLFCRQSNLDAKDRDARLGWVGGAIRATTLFVPRLDGGRGEDGDRCDPETFAR